jgi:hypothetical protein
MPLFGPWKSGCYKTQVKSQMMTYNIEEHQDHYGKASFLRMLDIGDEQCWDCIYTHQQQ